MPWRWLCGSLVKNSTKKEKKEKWERKTTERKSEKERSKFDVRYNTHFGVLGSRCLWGAGCEGVEEWLASLLAAAVDVDPDPVVAPAPAPLPPPPAPPLPPPLLMMLLRAPAFLAPFPVLMMDPFWLPFAARRLARRFQFWWVRPVRMNRIPQLIYFIINHINYYPHVTISGQHIRLVGDHWLLRLLPTNFHHADD